MRSFSDPGFTGQMESHTISLRGGVVRSGNNVAFAFGKDTVTFRQSNGGGRPYTFRRLSDDAWQAVFPGIAAPSGVPSTYEMRRVAPPGGRGSLR